MSSSLHESRHEIRDREHWLPPEELMGELGVRPGMGVAEIGAGVGEYSFPLGHRLGAAGWVLAVEWRPWVMEELRARLCGPGAPENVYVVEGRPADTHVVDESCDLVLMADIWHEIEHKGAALDEARRILRPEGRLAIVEWRPEGLCPPGPPLEHRVSMRRLLCDVEMKSWSLVKSRSGDRDGYVMVFEVTDESVQS